ncbi:pirin family protein [Deminuibacter soli]|uniref:Pirin family protein n=1 Tax=Deminuibacter soli TaxID=2291815 RepID=A0A3E1NPY6_9BACT|nr:pirin family protein [Deminuibacter soli]RFM29991.1 pirin family protein [Deminuibacter soli]
METVVYRASTRGLKDIGWLKSNFSFSFSSYQNPVKKSFGLLHTFNDDFVAKGGGFGIHPHSNMEIISIMLQGKMSHKDTLGYEEVVEKDWVQIMSAGSGLRHEEHNVGDEEVNFLQIWIEPKLQNINPRYQRRHFPPEKRKNTLQTVVSNEEGAAHCWINQNAKLGLGYYETAQTLDYSFNPVNKCVFVFVISGSVQSAGETLQARDAMGFWDTDKVSLEVTAGTELLLIEVPINH